VIAMIEAVFGAGPMAPPRGADRLLAGRRATRRRAIGVAAVTGRADGEEAVAPPARFLPQRRVHDVDAAVRADWTCRSNRGTREGTGSVVSEHRAVIEGLEVEAPGPHRIRRGRQLSHTRAISQNHEGPAVSPCFRLKGVVSTAGSGTCAESADGEHEVKPITHGNRVCLTYNLSLAEKDKNKDKSTKRPVVMAPVYEREVTAAAEI
jgi:hypothetical protein